MSIEDRNVACALLTLIPFDARDIDPEKIPDENGKTPE
jgi:hypothetical protein